MTTINVKGLKELQQFLDQFPAKMEANIMRGALRAGAKPIAEEARKNAPVGPTNAKNEKLYGGYPGALRDSIRVGAKIDKINSKVVGYARAGGKSSRSKADVFYPHFIEFGTRPHSNSKKGKGDANHPGISPRPFMRPALDSQAEAAIVATGEYIKKRLATKHGLNTADIDIGIEEEA